MPLSARLYKTEAIILRQRKLGEADRILTLYTPALGKLDAKAKGVRKTMSRLSGHLQPLNRVLVQLAQGHAADVITGVETLDSFRHLRDDLDLLSRGLYIAELTDRITPEHVHAFPTYRLLFDTLTRLDAGGRSGLGPFPTGQDGALTHGGEVALRSGLVRSGGFPTDADRALRFFEMRLLDQSGYRPQLDHCVACTRELEPLDNFFAPVAGGAVCRGCVPGLAGPRVLTLNGLKLLRLMQRGSYNDLARVKAPSDLSDEVERHLRSYIITVLERDVNAAAFIERLRRDGARTVVEA